MVRKVNSVFLTILGGEQDETSEQDNDDKTVRQTGWMIFT